jgi:HTH-type transcriptional regulator / antitoxin MqsA
MGKLPEKEVAMFKCHVCGHTTARDEFISEVFTIEGRRVLVENIPATVCKRCGEATFSRETTEKIRKMVYEATQPVRTVPLEVFAMG